MVEKLNQEQTPIEAVKAKREQYDAKRTVAHRSALISFGASTMAAATVTGMAAFDIFFFRKTGVKADTAEILDNITTNLIGLGGAIAAPINAVFGIRSMSAATDFSRRGAALEQALAQHTLATGELDAINDTPPPADY